MLKPTESKTSTHEARNKHGILLGKFLSWNSQNFHENAVEGH